MKRLLVVFVLSVIGALRLEALEPADLIGGGNFDNAELTERTRAQLKVLRELGARNCRVNLYPGAYLTRNSWDQPNERVLDAFLKEAHAHGVRPMILFEYYTKFHDEIGIGTEEQWRKIGRAFAERYRPNGVWARENGIRDWGVTLYTAFNEPEPTEFAPGRRLGPEPYVRALKGLADGVHSVERSLKVAPGGFMAANAFNDWKLKGIGVALAPLWNDGTLDGIDLHTYYDVKYAPMEGHYGDSAQAQFDAIQKACGISRDIDFICTEFNYKKRAVTEEAAAKGFLTAIWDHLGVVRNDGATPAAQIAFPWNIFHNAEKDTEYGMVRTLEPYQPTARGKVLKEVLQLTAGLHFMAYQPQPAGEYVLEGHGRKRWVWQNRKGWSKNPGAVHTLHGIPAGTHGVEVRTWQGLLRTVPTNGSTALEIDDLPLEETIMFLASDNAPAE